MPINQILGIRPEPSRVWVRPGSKLQTAINGFWVLLGSAHKEPTKCKQLVTGDPHFIGIMDAAKEGTVGVMVGKGDAYVPTVFHYKWPQDIQLPIMPNNKSIEMAIDTHPNLVL